MLIAAPVYKGKDYCIEKHLEAIRNIDYPFYHYIIVDNTDDNGEYTERLKKLGVEAYHVPRGQNSRQAIGMSMEFIRTYFLENNYDYLLVIESDLFPDPDVINRLIKHNRPVVGSFYLLGFEKDSKVWNEIIFEHQTGKITTDERDRIIKTLQIQRACIFLLDEKQGGFIGTRGISPKETYEYFKTGLRKVHGVGLGCTLIRKDILIRFPFWSDSRFDNKHPDVYFYMDLHNSGVSVFIDTNIMIPHQPSSWDDVTDR